MLQRIQTRSRRALLKHKSRSVRLNMKLEGKRRLKCKDNLLKKCRHSIFEMDRSTSPRFRHGLTSRTSSQMIHFCSHYKGKVHASTVFFLHPGRHAAHVYTASTGHSAMVLHDVTSKLCSYSTAGSLRHRPSRCSARLSQLEVLSCKINGFFAVPV